VDIGGAQSLVYSVFGRIGAIVPLASDYASFYAATNRGVPAGGAAGQVLAKSAAANYAMVWSNAGAGTVTNFLADDTALFLTGVSTPNSTPHLTFVIPNVNPHLFWGNNADVVGQPGFNALGFNDLPSMINSRLLGRGSTGGSGPPVGILLGTGLVMLNNTLSAPGTNSTQYNFLTSTSASDPGSGKLAFNNASGPSVSNLYLDSLNSDGTDMSAFLVLVKTGDVILIQDKGTAGNFIRLKVSSTPVNNTGWWTIPVTFVSSSGVLPNNNSPVAILVQML
jgi:hypothetical protein